MRDFVLKRALAFVFIFMTIFSAFGAEKIVFQASSPLMVSLGEAFRVEFQLNATPEEDTFEAPSFEGFDVLAGPVLSTGYSAVVINGSMTKTTNNTFTFVLMPRQKGNVQIGVASIEVDGQRYKTQPMMIEVVEESNAGAAQAVPQQKPSSQKQSAESQVAKDDLLLLVTSSRTSVYKGEPLRVSFKLCMRTNVSGLDQVKFPSFNGFWAQELNVNQRTSQRETIRGKVYETQVLREFLLYPQQTGSLTIEPASLVAVAQVLVQNRNYDPFFGMGQEVYNVPRELQSQRLRIEVKPLPQGAPASFNGAVGRFKMEAKMPEQHLTANSAATYRIKISGMGNLTFVQAPKLSLPTSFELYNVKTTESINTSEQGITGYRQFEYPFIARAEGEYDVAPVEFTYFDPQRIEYVTLSTEALHLLVSPDATGGSDSQLPVAQRGLSKEEVKLLGQDIRFIKMGDAHLVENRQPFLFSRVYWSLMGAILVVFGAIYYLLRKRIRESQNVALIRGKRANKVAVQRFRAAKRYMEQENRQAFYEEMLRALWGYMSDKFNIPVANLTKENVRDELAKRKIDPEEGQRFTSIITLCDEAQYSPIASARMTDVYAEGVDFISRIESSIKR